MTLLIMNDVVLTELLNDLNLWRRRAVAEWSAGPVVKSSFTHDASGMDEYVLVNWYGGVTSMPTYQSFTDTWSKSGYVNPFAFEWSSDKPIDAAYIAFVAGALHEQSLIWGSNLNDTSCFAFGHFLTFLDRVEKLYQYLLFTVKKRVHFI